MVYKTIALPLSYKGIMLHKEQRKGWDSNPRMLSHR
jgi:hypothetical protein